MLRRNFLKSSIGTAVLGSLLDGSNARGAAAQASDNAAAPFETAEGLTHDVAEFVVETRYTDIPAHVVDLGKKSILDSIGLAIAGATTEMAGLTRRYLGDVAKSGTATLIGSKQKLAPRFAAFANGIGIHADDYDDTQLAAAPNRVYGLLTHPSCSVFSAAFAAAEARNATGRELLLSYHLGVEVSCKVAEAIFPRHYEEGFHSSGTCNVFGSAAAAGKLAHLQANTLAVAFGIAASQAAGLRENFGTMTKPFHAGHAAEAGIIAVDLAALGWSASDRILEAPRGFFRAAGGGFDPAAIVGKLGHPWTFAAPGVSIKPHPSGSLTHPGMTELLRLMRAERFDASQVRQLEVGTNQHMPNALIHHQPQNGLQAKFSMEYCMAIVLLEGKAGLAEFTDERVQRADAQELLRRVRFYVDDEAERAGYDKMTTILKVHLDDGRTITGRADFAKGSPANPMTYEEVADKFRGCAEFARWPRARTAQIIDLVQRLEDVASVRRLAKLCA
jgi:2-methylcitrate dehydratase PrpD